MTGRYSISSLHHKDETLCQLAERGNIAQFVSFNPTLGPRRSRVRGFLPDFDFDGSAASAIGSLLQASVERSVNVRSYSPDSPKSRAFVYGLRTVEDAVGAVQRLAGEGLHTIVNETIDIHDGGVSGVAFGDLIEFAPDDTPRCVEKPGTAALPRAVALRLLETVYGFKPSLDYAPAVRIEFSLHPLRRGVRHGHTLVWEAEELDGEPAALPPRWPNRFSRLVGDKAYGLLIADALGLPVPASTVISRRLPPFHFGQKTGTGETWIRTCPTEQVPGKFTTKRGWVDPFALLSREDPSGEALAAVLAQEGVEPAFSGALVASSSGGLVVEGVAGQGDEFMQGRQAPERLPDHVRASLTGLYEAATALLGPVRFEWVHDGDRPWIVQFHSGITESTSRVIYPGEPPHYRRFPVKDGLEGLRQLISSVGDSGDGIALVGEVGVTSHMGDVLRKARIPSIIEAA